MEKYTYLLFTKGEDGLYVIDAFSTEELAREAMESNIAAQKEIEGLNDDNCYVDRHNHERVELPEVIIPSPDIIAHVTVNASVITHGKYGIHKAERYIVRLKIK